MKVLSLLICLLFSGILQAQEVKIAFQQQLPNSHPRYLTDSNSKSETLNLIEKEDWAKDIFEKLKKRTDLYANLTDAQPDWLLSRLAMYWKSHATDVYIKGEPSTMPEAKKHRHPPFAIPVRVAHSPPTDVPVWKM